MLNNFTIKLVKWLLGRDLTVDQRNSVSIHLMDSLDATPIRGIISVSDEGAILLNGSSLDMDKAIILRESARVALDNPALKIVNQEVLFTAVTMGIHKVEHPLQMLFARAAIWYGQQQELQLAILAQRMPQEPSL